MSKDQETEKPAKKVVTWLQLGITIVSIIGVGFKMYYDIRTNNAAIEELKKKAEKNNETIQQIQTNTAVMNVRLQTVDNRTANIYEKVEKINEMIIKLRP